VSRRNHHAAAAAALGALAVTLAGAAPLAAFSVKSAASPGCHEELTFAAYRAVTGFEAITTEFVQAPEDGVWRDLSAFLLSAAGIDPAGVDERHRYALVSLIVGARAPDTDGHSVANLDAMRALQADASAEGQHVHALRAPQDDGAAGDAAAVEGARRVLRDRLAAAAAYAALPPGEQNVEVPFYLDFYGRIDLEVNGVLYEVGRAAHLVQDSFSHALRAPDDLREILHVTNYVDAVADAWDEERDGLRHSRYLDECHKEPLRPLVDGARSATIDLFAASRDYLRDARADAVDEFVAEWLRYRAGCTPADQLCGHPELLALARRHPTRPYMEEVFGCQAGGRGAASGGVLLLGAAVALALAAGQTEPPARRLTAAIIAPTPDPADPSRRSRVPSRCRCRRPNDPGGSPMALSTSPRPLRLALPLAVLLFVSAVAFAQTDDERRREKLRFFDFDMELLDGSLGATPGGAQDVAFLRDRVAAGELPHANVFTPEGLFSEHDLPLSPRGACPTLLCVAGEAIAAGLVVQPDVRYLAQVGFASGLDPKTWRRAPLNLVAVVDQSGSMGGQPLDTVKASLHHLVDQLGGDDQLSVVLYGAGATVHLAPTPVRDEERRALHARIDAIRSEGSTYLELGLQTGFALARGSKEGFAGTTRVMLFTDERPNVGRTDAESFMGMAEAASRDGIGMTTIGVGVQFGAELATKVSSVRGGNLFFFPSVEKMEQVFEDELDTMVTELAYDLRLLFTPAPGLEIAGVYGIPGQMLRWEDGGALSVDIATVFLSRRKGAIYLALKSAAGPALPQTAIPEGAPVATVRLTYQERGGARQRDDFALVRRAPESVGPGLTRGWLLVNQATALEEALRLHHERNDQEGAYQLVHAIASLYRQTEDEDLAPERTLTEQLEHTLARLSGHLGEGPGAPRGPLAPEKAATAGPPDPVTGLPPRP